MLSMYCSDSSAVSSFRSAVPPEMEAGSEVRSSKARCASSSIFEKSTAAFWAPSPAFLACASGAESRVSAIFYGEGARGASESASNSRIHTHSRRSQEGAESPGDKPRSQLRQKVARPPAHSPASWMPLSGVCWHESMLLLLLEQKPTVKSSREQVAASGEEARAASVDREEEARVRVEAWVREEPLAQGRQSRSHDPIPIRRPDPRRHPLPRP